jgi:8-oxo-dGTP pyrophosphatase MutT (NUDIX family)
MAEVLFEDSAWSLILSDFCRMPTIHPSFVRSLAMRIKNYGVTFGAMADQEMPFRRPLKSEALDLGYRVRNAAVLLVLVPEAGQWSVVLMKRQEYSGVHSGQIAIPGGEVESGDGDAKATALREFEEEMGVKVPASNVFAQLTERYIPPSQFSVVPFLGFLNELPQWKLDGKEVAEAIIVPMKNLLVHNALKNMEIVLADGRTAILPAYSFDGHVIWGATAIMLTEFIAAWKTTFPNALKVAKDGSN